MSKTVIYMLRIVLCLSETQDVLPAKVIAERTGISVKYTEKCLNYLRNHYIVSIPDRGPNGGYKLLRDEVSFYNVLKQLYPERVTQFLTYGNTYDDKIKSLFDELDDCLKNNLNSEVVM